MKSANDGILTYVNSQWIEYNKYTDDAIANEAKNLASTANTTANTAKSTADSANATANTAHQEVQNTVNQVDIEYYLSTSATELIGGSWSTTAPNWVDGKYIWSRQKMYYVDSDKEPTYGEPACITGGKGATGADGKTGAEGKSAYQTALDQGFEGSEEDWLNSLIGQDGTGLESVTFLYYLTQNSENAPEKPTQTITENGDVKNQWTTKYATWESGYVY
ncbi:MAG: hypothetical protein IJV94_02810 [Bacilli bacterium]|nr:hypothetical protein [Bacilli bacterium]